MSRHEYLKTLENHLKLSLSRGEINDILRDYGEYFNEGENQGKSEWEIIAKLGDPKEVARQIISESNKGQPKKPGTIIFERASSAAKGAGGLAKRMGGAAKAAARAVGNFLKTSGGKITLVLLVLLCAPLWVGACAALLGALLAFFGGLAGLALLCVAVVLCGVAAVVATSLFMTVLPFTVVLLLLILSVGLVAGGVLGVSLLLLVFNWGARLVSRLGRWLISKTGASPAAALPKLPDEEGGIEHA